MIFFRKITQEPQLQDADAAKHTAPGLKSLQTKPQVSKTSQNNSQPSEKQKEPPWNLNASGAHLPQKISYNNTSKNLQEDSQPSSDENPTHAVLGLSFLHEQQERDAGKEASLTPIVFGFSLLP